MFEHNSNPQLPTDYWIEEHRKSLIDTLREDITTIFYKKHFNSSSDLINEILSMCHIISESVIFTYSY